MAKEKIKDPINPILIYTGLMILLPFILGLFLVVEVDFSWFKVNDFTTDYMFLLYFIFFIIEGIGAFLTVRYNERKYTFATLMAFSFVIKLVIFVIISLISHITGVGFESFTIGNTVLDFENAYYSMLFARLELAKVGGLITYIPTLICLPTILGSILGKKCA